MKQDALAKWLKFIIAGVGICGLLTYTVIMPRFAAYLVRQNSMLEKNVLPWLILIWISAIPCYAVLVLGWKIADNIRMDRSFSYENARYRHVRGSGDARHLHHRFHRDLHIHLLRGPFPSGGQGGGHQRGERSDRLT